MVALPNKPPVVAGLAPNRPPPAACVPNPPVVFVEAEFACPKRPPPVEAAGVLPNRPPPVEAVLVAPNAPVAAGC